MDWYRLIRPALFALPAEAAHDLALWCLSKGLVPRPPAPGTLPVEAFGLSFPNPLGLAAGFDKNAQAVEAAFTLGFGFVEIGSVTPRPQPGNPKPRLFRLPRDRGVINRFGFNSEGMEAVAGRLEQLRRKTLPGPLGVNLGKNKETEDAAADYVAGTKRLGPLADYLVVNVSSPNTPGLRDLQAKAELEALLARVREAIETLPNSPPLLVKVAPDLSDAELDDVAAIAGAGLVAGIIATNATLSRPPGLHGPRVAEAGGVSGAPLRPLALRAVERLAASTSVPMIGLGGIDGPETAAERLDAGATLIQLYSALVYEGPALPARIVRGLASR